MPPNVVTRVQTHPLLLVARAGDIRAPGAYVRDMVESLLLLAFTIHDRAVGTAVDSAGVVGSATHSASPRTRPHTDAASPR